MSTEPRDLKIPDSWWAEPIRLAPAEHDSEPVDEQAEIERLAELGNSMKGRLT